MRKLIYVPIIHSEDDMGSLAEFMKKEYKRKYSRQKWEEHTKAIKEIWNKIREKVIGLDLEWQKVRIYQDGLPVNGKEQFIVKTLAEKGNLNYKLILELVKKGARIEGTEDMELLKAEYANILRIAQAKNITERDRLIEQCNQVASDLLVKRDRFIANRINETLKEGETGILFLGMMHQVHKLIPRDIVLTYPLSG
ncbi:MAG: hypothetical protein QMD71_02060 [bacterium]|nr:hypothetical protein [bacterium]